MGCHLLITIIIQHYRHIVMHYKYVHNVHVFVCFYVCECVFFCIHVFHLKTKRHLGFFPVVLIGYFNPKARYPEDLN